MKSTFRPENSAMSVSFIVAIGLMVLVGGWSFTACAGTVSFEYYQVGAEPGSVWVLVHMDPVDWGSCSDCLLPDWSRIHISPAPLQPDPWSGSSYPWGSIYYDETGAYVHGDGFSRMLVLDVATSYLVTDAITRRGGFAMEMSLDGSWFCSGAVGCTYEVTDYAPMEINPITVAGDDQSFSTIKARYQN